MVKLPDELKHPSGGEPIDRAAREAIRLAHRALERFPELMRRHKYVAGGAAVSSTLVVLAGVAIARRVLRGESAEEAVQSVTEDEVQGLRVLEVQGDAPTNGAGEREQDGAERPPEQADARAQGDDAEDEPQTEVQDEPQDGPQDERQEEPREEPREVERPA